MKSRKDIEDRIEWLEGEIASSNHFDGYVLQGLQKELEEKKKKLEEYNKNPNPWDLKS